MDAGGVHTYNPFYRLRVHINKAPHGLQTRSIASVYHGVGALEAFSIADFINGQLSLVCMRACVCEFFFFQNLSLRSTCNRDMFSALFVMQYYIIAAL